MSGQKPMPQPGTPAAELASLSEEEGRLATLELALLDRAAAVESTAREVQTALERARTSLHALAGSSVHAEAEALFNRTLAMEAPPHLVSRETSEALELRRRALALRAAALRIEEESLQRRTSALAELRKSAEALQAQSAELARRIEEETLRKQRQAEAERWAQEEEARKAREEAARREAELLRAAAPPAVEEPVFELTRKKPQEPEPFASPPAATPEPASAPQTQPVAAGPKASPPSAQRSYRRVGVQTEVSLVSESNFFAGFSQNLSEMGVFVATYTQLLPVGTEVVVTLNLPSRPGMKVHGVVKWVRDATDRTPGVFPGMGILFEELSETDARAIKTFVAQREPLFWAE